MEWKTGEQTHPDPSADKTQLRHPSLLLRLVPSEDRLDASALPRSNSRTKGVQAAQCETYDLLEELVGEGDEGPKGVESEGDPRAISSSSDPTERDGRARRLT